jgi:uncharacterized membrane protein
MSRVLLTKIENGCWPAAILILNFFATYQRFHGLFRIFTDGHLLFCFIFDLLNFSVLIRVLSGFVRG